ncbi:MAG TPA: hypothetical protein VJQ25_10750, partial [Nitrospira sp.]|nr:hypothetical protein [Nitrospira sp.]
ENCANGGTRTHHFIYGSHKHPLWWRILHGIPGVLSFMKYMSTIRSDMTLSSIGLKGPFQRNIEDE